MRAEILRVHRGVSATAVYVTHDQVEAMTMGDRIAVVNEGVIQQVGTPDELYDRPANRFVAGFIGTPPMGFLSLDRAAGDAPELTGPGVRLRLGDGVMDALPSGARRLVAGIRPEHLTPAQAGAPGDSTVAGTVEVIEPLGWEQHVMVRVGDELITARLARQHRLAREDKVTFRVEPGQMHVFDPESGQAYC
jgi:multiple sugar transport system ATP-binding protein